MFVLMMKKFKSRFHLLTKKENVLVLTRDKHGHKKNAADEFDV